MPKKIDYNKKLEKQLSIIKVALEKCYEITKQVTKLASLTIKPVVKITKKQVINNKKRFRAKKK